MNRIVQEFVNADTLGSWASDDDARRFAQLLRVELQRARIVANWDNISPPGIVDADSGSYLLTYDAKHTVTIDVLMCLVADMCLDNGAGG